MDGVWALRALGGVALVGVGVAFAVDAFRGARNYESVGRAWVQWWIKEAHTPSGRRRWTHWPWWSTKYEDPAKRREVAPVEGVLAVVFEATASLVALLLAVVVARGG